jgi:hypothetical protein
VGAYDTGLGRKDKEPWVKDGIDPVLKLVLKVIYDSFQGCFVV